MHTLIPLLLGAVLLVTAAVAMVFALGLFGLSSKLVRRRLAVTGSLVKSSTGGTIAIRFRDGVSDGGVAKALTTGSAFAKIERNVLLAGQPDGWTVRRVVTAKLVLTAIGALILFIEVSGGPSLMSILLGITAICVGYFAPDILIQKRAETRQHAIQQELPDVLDQVTISIESGLGFEAAFARIGERRTGPLAEEIVRTVQDMRLGMSRRDAYQALADRTDVDDLRRFVKSVVQSEQFGVSISTVVRTQASEIRFKRRKRAEATALKVPVKIIFPLMVCILPVLFIVILTPAIMGIGKSLG